MTRRSARIEIARAAAKKLTAIRGRSSTFEKPSVSIDEPANLNAARHGVVPRPQKIIVNPASAPLSHTSGRQTSVSGAYIDITS